jgi:hypothetical protein
VRVQPQVLSLRRNEPQLLVVVVEFLIFWRDNQRSLDYFASQFLFYLRLFRLRALIYKGHSSSGNLLTKEIVYAFHTMQQDTLIQECIEKIA